LSSVTVSIGIAIFPDHGVTSETLIGAADQALYRAKDEGRDRFRFAEPIRAAEPAPDGMSG
jgi:diguanylate cyclase (GGDEF)-like protein